MFVLNNWLREFPLSAVANHFEFGLSIEATIVLTLQNLSLLPLVAEAPSTPIRITAFSVTENEGSPKASSRVDIFESAVFPFSCGPVEMELIKNADVTASIYKPSENALGSLGIMRGHFVHLFLDCEYHSVDP